MPSSTPALTLDSVPARYPNPNPNPNPNPKPPKVVTRPRIRLMDYTRDKFDVIFNDHNIALNNGAFFLRAGKESIAPYLVQVRGVFLLE